MSSCPLFALPRELRDQIYTHLYAPSSNHTTLFVLGHSTRYRLANFSLQSHSGPDYTTALRTATSLLRTCRQLRHEATPFFADSIIYKIVVEGSSPGSIGSRLPEETFRSLVQRMRRVLVGGVRESEVERCGAGSFAFEEEFGGFGGDVEGV
ncbi:hypothetical protein PRZ48_005621 [Zasmidium cellare]|uniref:Uncharacterized protein n=1 Tax=Zasmidium cellare TaxID=395010 RepID=A0ABR0ELQ2_ZASCE|nr:hypothetical protein PRZ48_005621 [Zasmidium cellare]